MSTPFSRSFLEALKNALRVSLKTHWRERLVQADPRRWWRKWEAFRIFRAYHCERNRYILPAARVEVTVTPGEAGPSALEIVAVGWNQHSPEALRSFAALNEARVSFGYPPITDHQLPQPLEPLATPPWEKHETIDRRRDP